LEITPTKLIKGQESAKMLTKGNEKALKMILDMVFAMVSGIIRIKATSLVCRHCLLLEKLIMSKPFGGL
jgi:hypothetical protein